MSKNGEKGGVAFDRSKVQGGVNLMARYAQYEPGVDARDKKNLGKTGAPIHGKILGRVTLPSVQQNGKPWIALAVKLLQPCPCKEGETGEVRMAPAGETILVTQTAALDSMMSRGLESAIDDPKHVYEVFIEPEVSQTKQTRQSLWVFKEFRILGRHDRAPNEIVGIRSLYPELGAETSAPQLPPAREEAHAS